MDWIFEIFIGLVSIISVGTALFVESLKRKEREKFLEFQAEEAHKKLVSSWIPHPPGTVVNTQGQQANTGDTVAGVGNGNVQAGGFMSIGVGYGSGVSMDHPVFASGETAMTYMAMNAYASACSVGYSPQFVQAPIGYVPSIPAPVHEKPKEKKMRVEDFTHAKAGERFLDV